MPLRIAYLSPWSPWPPDFGGAMRVEALWSALRAAGEVHLAVVGAAPPPPVRRRLRAAGVRLLPPRRETPLRRQARLFGALLADRCIPAARYVSPRRLDRMRAWLAELSPDVIVLGDEYLASLAGDLAGLGARVVIDTHNAASRGHWRIARRARGAVARLQYACLAVNTARVERRSFPRADQVWAVSAEDAAFYERLLDRPVAIVPNVVDVPEAPGPGGDPRTAVLTGSWSYAPSEDAALRLVELAAPLLADATLHRLLLVGRDPTVRLRAAAARHAGVEVTGAVPSVAPYLRAGAVFAAPIASGSGTKLKVLEAMAQGCAVLTTPLGAEGLAIDPGVHAEVTDLAGFAAALRRLLAAPDRRAALGRAGHELVRARYSREAMSAAVARQLAMLLPGSRAGEGGPG